jgi:hypothetical protein
MATITPREVTYHFLPQTIQCDLDDDVACARWRDRARADLRRVFPTAEVVVSYELGVRGCTDWLTIDGDGASPLKDRVADLLDESFARMTVEYQAHWGR